MIEVGERLPDGAFRVKADDGSVEEISVEQFFAARKVVLVGLPGAFTSTCHNSHAPQFVENADAMRVRGVDGIAILSVNDHHVMKAWAGSLDGDGKIDFLADPIADFTRAIGMDVDMSRGGLGVRCRRFSAVVEDRVVGTVNLEAEGSRGVSATGAATILTQLQP